MSSRGGPWIPPPMLRMRPPHPGMRFPPPTLGMGPPRSCMPRFHNPRGPHRGRAMPRGRGRGRGAPGFRYDAPPFMSKFGAGKRPHADEQDQNKKQKVTDSEKNEGKEGYCETCDRSFRTQEALTEHKAQHQTCGLEGCSFTAHPKIIEKHIEAQHLSGLFNRIGRMDSPEDIARWIADRKKNYPSRANIERKNAQKEEKINRGERLFPDTSLFNTDWRRRGRGGRGRGRGRGGHEFNQRGRGRGRGSFHLRKRGTGFSFIVKDDEELEDRRRKLRGFPGTGIFEEKVDEKCAEKLERTKEDYSDSEWEGSSLASISNSSVPQACDALNSLMAVYGSDSDDGPEEVSILHSEESLVINNFNTTMRTEPSVKLVSHANSKDNVEYLESENMSKEEFPGSSDTCLSEITSVDLHGKVECENKISKETSANDCSDRNMETELEDTETDEILTDTRLDEVDSHGVNSSTNGLSDVLEFAESAGNMDSIVENVQKLLEFSSELECETSCSREMRESVLDPVNKISELRNGPHPDNVRFDQKSLPCDEANRKSQNGPKNEKQNPAPYRPYMRVKRKTLLEKLLAKEILHERNVLLQCVRHVVDENFFGLEGQSKRGISTTEPSNSRTSFKKNEYVLLQCIQFIVKSNFFENEESGE